MPRSKNLLRLLTTVSISLLAGTTAHADKGTLQIWINGDRPANLTQIAERFTKETGLNAIVEHPQDMPAALKKAVASGSGPDVMIWAHDKPAAEWITAGLIEPINPKPKFKGEFENIGWDAFTFGGKTYGYPLTIETIALVYNKKLAPKPPSSFEEILTLDKTLAKQGKHAILWDYNNTFFTFSLLAANGGYPFGRSFKTGQVSSDVGVNNGGALKGAETLATLISSGALPKTVTPEAPEAAMIKGEVAATLSGPLVWANLRKANLDLGVAPIPSIGGKSARAFVGVQGAMIWGASKQKALATKFVEEYLTTAEGLKAFDVELRISARKDLNKARATDPLFGTMMKIVRTGMTLPITPKTERFLSTMKTAFGSIAGGQKPKEALDAAALQLKAP